MLLAATALGVVGLSAAFFLIERFAPLRRATRELWPRLFVNVIVAGLAFAAAAVTVRPAVARVIQTDGLIALLPEIDWLRFGAVFLAMDLSFYYWHLANHRIPFLWRFHNVHHVDPDLDVSTAFRFHFCEVAFSALFRILQVVVIGPTAMMYAAYEVVFQANTIFHHSNIRIPIRWERLLNRIIVTPRMHGIHHSQVEGETNSNYSVVFCWWDRIHRTLGLNIPQRSIAIGVPGYTAREDNRLPDLLLLPFREQREYWTRSDGARPTRPAEDLVGSRTELAE